MEKQTLFISYCWKDGCVYADELETQLADEFDVKRDKSQLIINDDLYSFMKGIADCDNVVIVLTTEYVKSLNCMLEMSYLFAQDDWHMKAMVLVIDDSLYSIDRKIEILNYWNLRQKKYSAQLGAEVIGSEILSEEKEYIDRICDQLEGFLKGVSRRKNPSQIAIVNEIIKKSRNRNKDEEEEIISKGEQFVLAFLKENGHMTVKELSEKMNRSQYATHRYLHNLIAKGKIVCKSGNRYGEFEVVEE